MMNLLWITIGAVVLITIVGLLILRLITDKGNRASGEHHFRAAAKTPVALPYLRDGSYAAAALTPLPPMNLPGPVSDRPAARKVPMSADASTSRAGGFHHRDWTVRKLTITPAPAPNRRAGNWPNERHVIPARVLAALAGASPDDTVTSRATLQPYVRLMLTCPLEFLDDAVAADKMTLALAGAS